MTDRIIEIAVGGDRRAAQSRVEGLVIAVHQSDEVLNGWTPGTRARTARAA